jgi:hypothetical protein
MHHYALQIHKTRHSRPCTSTTLGTPEHTFQQPRPCSTSRQHCRVTSCSGVGGSVRTPAVTCRQNITHLQPVHCCLTTGPGGLSTPSRGGCVVQTKHVSQQSSASCWGYALLHNRCFDGLARPPWQSMCLLTLGLCPAFRPSGPEAEGVSGAGVQQHLGCCCSSESDLGAEKRGRGDAKRCPTFV